MTNNKNEEPVFLWKGKPMTPEQIQRVAEVLDQVVDRLHVEKDMEALEEDR